MEMLALIILYFLPVFGALCRAEYNPDLTREQKTKWKLALLLLHPSAVLYYLNIEKDKRIKIVGIAVFALAIVGIIAVFIGK